VILPGVIARDLYFAMEIKETLRNQQVQFTVSVVPEIADRCKFRGSQEKVENYINNETCSILYLYNAKIIFETMKTQRVIQYKTQKHKVIRIKRKLNR